MSRLPLTIAFSDYDRVAALSNGQVRPDGIDLNFLTLPVEETFFRMARHAEFDVAEMSLSSYCMTLARDPAPFIAIPVFPSRVFRHGSMFVSTKSGISSPTQLAGKRIAYPEYQMTAPVWMRGILSDDYGVRPSEVLHYSGGVEQPGRIEKLKLNLPPSIRWQPIGPEQTLADMLADGEVDALLAARPPSTLETRPDAVRRLFPDYAAEERAYFKRTRIFPIMHTVVIRREVYEANRWIAQSLLKAFCAAQRKTYADLAESHAFKAMLPWLPSHVEEVKREMGEDWWPYGFAANRHVLDTFLRYHHEQGLSPKRLAPEALFAPESLENFLI
ncbi:ABC transporter substrate-binding protein [Aquincola sp. S2]|uniref:ABC transporter substrate-binding protein n=1 Tax=Pseudaquabacterium terrae TaxID=2732868 RepID=A0ABX2ETQ0_9BURK|nr:ABC transporter substrate-binding protein [Aquabacterium terrae]NRF71872.1 ABC transporter substrate-binding protein [Aquabacterium terrae]